MSSRVPRMRDPGDIRGGLFHLFAEVAALAALLGTMAVLAWLFLLL